MRPFEQQLENCNSRGNVWACVRFCVLPYFWFQNFIVAITGTLRKRMSWACVWPQPCKRPPLISVIYSGQQCFCFCVWFLSAWVWLLESLFTCPWEMSFKILLKDLIKNMFLFFFFCWNSNEINTHRKELRFHYPWSCSKHNIAIKKKKKQVTETPKLWKT